MMPTNLLAIGAIYVVRASLCIKAGLRRRTSRGEVINQYAEVISHIKLSNGQIPWICSSTAIDTLGWISSKVVRAFPEPTSRHQGITMQIMRSTRAGSNTQLVFWVNIQSLDTGK